MDRTSRVGRSFGNLLRGNSSQVLNTRKRRAHSLNPSSDSESSAPSHPKRRPRRNRSGNELSSSATVGSLSTEETTSDVPKTTAARRNRVPARCNANRWQKPNEHTQVENTLRTRETPTMRSADSSQRTFSLSNPEGTNGVVMSNVAMSTAAAGWDASGTVVNAMPARHNMNLRQRPSERIQDESSLRPIDTSQIATTSSLDVPTLRSVEGGASSTSQFRTPENRRSVLPTADSANGGGRVRKVNLIAAMSDFVVRTEPDRWREPPEFGAVSTMAWRHRFPLFGNRATTPGSPPVRSLDVPASPSVENTSSASHLSSSSSVPTNNSDSSSVPTNNSDSSSIPTNNSASSSIPTNNSASSSIPTNNSDSSPRMCSICFDEFTDQKIGLPNGCKHLFCAKCIVKWSISSTTCPIDRKRFNSVTVMRRIGEEPFLRLEFDARSLPLQPMDPELMTCVVCQKMNKEKDITYCYRCTLPYHIFCINPPLPTMPDYWYCRRCGLSYRDVTL